MKKFLDEDGGGEKLKTSVHFIHSDKEVRNIFINGLKDDPVQPIHQDDQLIFYVFVPLSTSEIEYIKYIAGELRKKAEKFSITSLKVLFDGFYELKYLKRKKCIYAFFEGWYLASYRFLKYKSTAQERKIRITYDPIYNALEAEALLVANAVCVARDLCNEPANKLTPISYARKIDALFKDTKVKVTILDKQALLDHGFHATYEVGKGSNHSPKVALLNYENGGKKKMALVGKGVTFDTGGMNLKQVSDIVDMKMDMGGSASVIGAMKLVESLQVPVNLQAIIPLVENIPSFNSYLPSDVIRYANGKTVEVGNTDAEGRLILADALLYAQKVGATWITDIATLTGTIGQALGLNRAGIYSNQLESISYYEEISAQTGDFIWPMPLVEEYNDLLESECADIKNISSSPFGGSITAAMFLHSFITDNSKWIHIDMANVVKPFKVKGYYVDGASGFKVRLLTELIRREVNGNRC